MYQNVYLFIRSMAGMWNIALKIHINLSMTFSCCIHVPQN